MSGARERSSRCVFVGNIPYDTTEEQLIEKFNEVGPVVSFRLVFDRDTGKPKGYGFCEFKDSETAMSAMRNLNGFELNGRPLRVDFAENEKGLEKRQKRGAPAPGGGGRGRPGSRFDMEGQFGGEGEGFQGGGFESGPPPPGVSHEQQIINILENMSTLQLYEMMAQMKTLIEQNRDQAREVLMGNPQFAFALLQAQVILGMVEPVVVQQILQQSQQQPSFPQQPVPPFAQQPPPQMQPPPSYQEYQRPPEFGMPPGPMYPTQGLPPQGPPSMGGVVPGGPVVPPVVAPVGQMPPPMGVPNQPMMGMPPQQQPPSQASILDQQKLLLQQVMQLTPQQIETLPPLQRQQVQQLQMQIKSQLGAGLRP